MENVRNGVNIKLVSNKKDCLNWTSKQSYMSHKIFDNDLVMIDKNKVTLTLNKPAYIEICILEFSKISMYKFHYDYNKNKYDQNLTLLFTDTDNLMYEIKHVDVYKDISDKEMFDFCNYSTNLVLQLKTLSD